MKFFPGTSSEEVKKQVARDQLKILEALDVLPREEIEAMASQLEKKKMDEIDWKGILAQLRREAGTGEQRPVSPEEAERLMEKGWRWIGNLPNAGWSSNRLAELVKKQLKRINHVLHADPASELFACKGNYLLGRMLRQLPRVHVVSDVDTYHERGKNLGFGIESHRIWNLFISFSPISRASRRD